MRKARSLREIPPPLELECLRALWSLGQGNVRLVREALLPSRVLAYTTVMTVLERLVRKGAATRAKNGRSFLYAPALSREALRRVAVRDLVNTLFGGSEQELIDYLKASRPAAAAAAASASAAAPASAGGQEPPLDTALL
jgi:predicted transcriptional regulator